MFLYVPLYCCKIKKRGAFVAVTKTLTVCQKMGHLASYFL